ncbi:MAG: glycosyltransferase, partial [Thermoguttaceae bacterium]|nr:glycosyltransferase [Thermoguttaceae bacterium]
MSGEMSYPSIERGCVDGETEKRREKILVAIATYNEIDNIPRLTDRLLSLLPDADVLIVDDNSPDGTGAWAKKAGERDSRVKALVRQNERGLGSAVICALKYAIEYD